MSARGSANVLTRTTAILAAVFFPTSIGLTLLTRYGERPASILDRIQSQIGASDRRSGRQWRHPEPAVRRAAMARGAPATTPAAGPAASDRLAPATTAPRPRRPPPGRADGAEHQLGAGLADRKASPPAGRRCISLWGAVDAPVPGLKRGPGSAATSGAGVLSQADRSIGG